MADVVNSPIRITDVQQTINDRHTHPAAAKAIADGLTEAPPTQASVATAQSTADNAIAVADLAQLTATQALDAVDGKQDALTAGQLAALSNAEVIDTDRPTTEFLSGDGTYRTPAGGGVGTSDHALLSNLEYENSGHTGFSPTVHEHTTSDITDLPTPRDFAADPITEPELAANAVTDSKIGLRSVQDQAADSVLINSNGKYLATWLQGIRNNLKYTFDEILKIAELETEIDRREVLTLVVNDDQTEIIVTYSDNTQEHIDISKAEISLDYDPDTKELIFIDTQGNEQRIPLGDLVPVFEGSTGAHIDIDTTSNVISAQLKAGTVTKTELHADLVEFIEEQAFDDSEVNNELVRLGDEKADRTELPTSLTDLENPTSNPFMRENDITPFDDTAIQEELTRLDDLKADLTDLLPINNELDRLETAKADRTDLDGLASEGYVDGEISDHNTSTTSHADIRTELATTKAIAEGASRGLVFDTKVQLDEWIAGTYVRPDGIVVGDLRVGDNLFIRSLDDPDFWWDGTGLNPLSEKVDLTGLASEEWVKENLNAMDRIMEPADPVSLLNTVLDLMPSQFTKRTVSFASAIWSNFADIPPEVKPATDGATVELRRVGTYIQVLIVTSGNDSWVARIRDVDSNPIWAEQGFRKLATTEWANDTFLTKNGAAYDSERLGNIVADRYRRQTLDAVSRPEFTTLLEYIVELNPPSRTIYDFYFITAIGQTLTDIPVTGGFFVEINRPSTSNLYVTITSGTNKYTRRINSNVEPYVWGGNDWDIVAHRGWVANNTLTYGVAGTYTLDETTIGTLTPQQWLNANIDNRFYTGNVTLNIAYGTGNFVIDNIALRQGQASLTVNIQTNAAIVQLNNIEGNVYVVNQMPTLARVIFENVSMVALNGTGTITRLDATNVARLNLATVDTTDMTITDLYLVRTQATYGASNPRLNVVNTNLRYDSVFAIGATVPNFNPIITNENSRVIDNRDNGNNNLTTGATREWVQRNKISVSPNPTDLTSLLNSLMSLAEGQTNNVEVSLNISAGNLAQMLDRPPVSTTQQGLVRFRKTTELGTVLLTTSGANPQTWVRGCSNLATNPQWASDWKPQAVIVKANTEQEAIDASTNNPSAIVWW